MVWGRRIYINKVVWGRHGAVLTPLAPLERGFSHNFKELYSFILIASPAVWN